MRGRLLDSWNDGNNPPLDHDELQATFESAKHSAKKPPGSETKSTASEKVKINFGGGSKSAGPKAQDNKLPEPTTAEILFKLSDAAELWHTPDGDGYPRIFDRNRKPPKRKPKRVKVKAKARKVAAM